ncbi:hypothetical protein FQA39_LY07686 [Lamprigera yunnana]|nr:hypothetical protein FQA39_LY07686 [Lamprigera yunnana]
MSLLRLILIIFAISTWKVESCHLKISAFRAYRNNFVVFEMSYDGSPQVVGINLGLDEPNLNVKSIHPVEKAAGLTRHGVSLQPHTLRVGDTIYYRLFAEGKDGKLMCETDLNHFQIQGGSRVCADDSRAQYLKENDDIFYGDNGDERSADDSEVDEKYDSGDEESKKKHLNYLMNTNKRKSQIMSLNLFF